MSREEKTGHIIVFITCPDEDRAALIARSLVEQKRAACVNIVRNIRSIYAWKGNIEDDAEVLMIVKTRHGHFDALSAAVKKLHPYDVPEIIAFPITAGSDAYLKWLTDSTG